MRRSSRMMKGYAGAQVDLRLELHRLVGTQRSRKRRASLYRCTSIS